MKTFKDRFISCIVICSPIDDWSTWTPLFNNGTLPFSSGTIKPISPEFFSAFVEFITKLSHTEWEGDIRNDVEIYFKGDHSIFYGPTSFLFGIKQDNDGTTFIGGDDFNDIIDEIRKRDADPGEKIYPILQIENNGKSHNKNLC